METHCFWNTQLITTPSTKNDYIVINPESLYSNTPSTLPGGMEWVTFDIQTDVEQLYDFLKIHYLESLTGRNKVVYSKQTLSWYLSRPSSVLTLNIGIKYNNKIMGCIFGTSTKLHIFDKTVSSIIIDFLCVHKGLRHKQIAPALIKEISRRSVENKIYHAYYTSIYNLPNKISETRYYIRPIKIEKLLKTQLIKNKEKSLKRLFQRYKVLIPTFSSLEEKDLKNYFVSFNEYTQQYKVSNIFLEDEFIEHFRFRLEVIETYLNKDNYISYYYIDYKVDTCDVKFAFVYYYVCKTMTLSEMIESSIGRLNCDGVIVKDKVEKCDEISMHINHYFYNWECEFIENSQIKICLI